MLPDRLSIIRAYDNILHDLLPSDKSHYVYQGYFVTKAFDLADNIFFKHYVILPCSKFK